MIGHTRLHILGEILFTIFFVGLTACGVRQYNSHIIPSTSVFYSAFGPLFASGQQGNSMSTPACAGAGHHPCVHARASVGMPYQFDMNSNYSQGAILSGNKFPGAGPYSSVAGPGKTNAASYQSTGRYPNLPYAENIDLHMLQSQAAPGNQNF